MESLSQTGAESPPPPPPPDPEPTRQERIEYLTKTLPKLRSKTDTLLQRYQEAGIKWHLLPFVARASKHNDPVWIDTLDEIYSVEPADGSLAECVYESFSRMVSFIVDGQKALDRGGPHLGAAQVFVDGASYEVMKMEEKVSMTETAVADVIAVRNALDEQDLLTTPEVWLDVKLFCFQTWLEALSDAEQDWIEMKS